jgi:CTP synthase
VASEKAIDVLIVELGGTVGDIESEPFLEAVRQFRLEEGRERTALVHVALVPYLETVGQLKTKPVQHSVTALLSAGLQPDVVIGRSSRPLTDEIKAKIGLYSNVPKEAVISNPDIDIIYELPVIFENQGLGDYICRMLDLPAKKPETREWAEVVKRFKEAKEVLRIAMPGKYTKIVDSYISINEALKHAAASQGATVRLEFVGSELIESNPAQLKKLEAYDGILLTPGFGTRGVEGMISTAEKAISSKIPFLGTCFGAQLLFIAFCRSIGLKGANSTEIDPKTPNPVVDLLPEQRRIAEKGGTMRLGEHEIFIKKDTNLFGAYGRTRVIERFRHRYHLMQNYAKKARNKGLVVSATDRGGRIINAIEIEGKDNWVVGTQFHPEFTSRPNRPNPVYYAFIEAALRRKRARE